MNEEKDTKTGKQLTALVKDYQKGEVDHETFCYWYGALASQHITGREILSHLDDEESTPSFKVSVDSGVAAEAQEILEDMRLNLELGINLFLDQVVKQERLPFIIGC
ncbi:hypothetical protein P7E02_14835 [Enterococcus hulanensis]|uniref:hypothetical protein n=1 Tax=Enterococcus hulanensis TaxID=2559929 RepID=UPI00288E4408|nr:hypothetical protein [Enterococcus hulanensis]MDT2661148.1 hypothetical protein [Enterococcus hulanensis]